MAESAFTQGQTLAKVPIFSGLAENELSFLAQRALPRPHAKTIERHFGCPVVCGGPRNAIVFRTADAQRLFVTRNAELLAMLAPQF
jgi:hypothetical protein